MADALSVTGLILTVVGSVGSVLAVIDKIQAAPQLLESLRSDLNALQPSLSQLDAIIRQSAHNTVPITDGLSPALQQFKTATELFTVSLGRWTKHSADGKLAWRDGLSIATRHQSQILVFQQHLAACKQSLALSITATYLSRQIATSSRDADYTNQVAILQRDTTEATRLFGIEMARVSEQIRELAFPSLADHGSQSVDTPDTDIQRLQHYKAAIKCFQKLCSESIPKAVPELSRQRISNVSTNLDSIAYVGIFNEVDGAAQVDQDLSHIKTDNKSFSIVGKANGIDFNQMFANKFK